MGKKWKRHMQHKRWLASKSGGPEAAAPAVPTAAKQAEPEPAAPVVEAPVKAPPKKVRRSTKKSAK